MIYLAKGIVTERRLDKKIIVVNCGQKYTLSEMESYLWLNGQRRFSYIVADNQLESLARLEKNELAVSSIDNGMLGKYKILTRCLLCSAKTTDNHLLSRREKQLLLWLDNTKIHLSVAELIYLFENKVKPTNDILKNRQSLIDTIYKSDVIVENLLEKQMETAAARDEIINAIMGLLNKQRINVL